MLGVDTRIVPQLGALARDESRKPRPTGGRPLLSASWGAYGSARATLERRAANENAHPEVSILRQPCL